VTRALVLGTALVLLGALVVLPLGVLGASLLADPAAGLAALAHPLNVRAAWNTVLLSVAVLAFTLAIGVPLGFLLGRTDLPGRATWRAVCTIPYVVPPYVTAIAWITLLNPTNGLLNRGLLAAGLPPLDIYTLGGMTWVMGLALVPFVMLATADSLARMDASLEEQARIAGAGPWRRVRASSSPSRRPRSACPTCSRAGRRRPSTC
jgi:iron(III) transport system permease protein